MNQKWDLKVSIDGPVASIDLNRPEVGNTLTRDMMRVITERLHELGRNPDLKVIAFRPSGSDFCLGRDRSGEAEQKLSAYEDRTKIMGVILDVYSALASCPIPVVACVKGRAVGFGAALAGACDVTLAASSAKFAFTEIKHNSPPTLAMAAVRRNVPVKALTYLIYSAEEIDAQQAVGFGLVSRVFASETFDQDATSFLTSLAQRPRLTLETIKRFQANAANLSPDMVSEYAGTLLALVRSAQ